MTPNKEDYLKCIYNISISKEKVTNKLVAEIMNVSKPAVTEMLRKLVNSKLIEKDNSKGYTLTEEALILVSNVVRKHRLLEVFLLEHLAYPTNKVHEEAEILEHAVSDFFIDSLDKMLGYPNKCPHGSIIPQKNIILEDDIVLLSEALQGKIYYVKRLSAKKEITDYLLGEGIKLGSKIIIKEKSSLGKIIKLEVDELTISLSDHLASHIFLATNNL
ncbi:metal-dependent transcriptional regulator [Gemella sp. zg-1178]|uniref:metal-dependent transcriptional regulator n=1 Tax=Gemella sp. zg-1178 TaxID=2840372 RepID=UPI001C048B70|nr:metal-dependent transcriptional regulator [Gemella sp. zg-1178]MBU0278748.1 metal-dependent transcriptional regulator [Gemella sp. zg-1178]